MKRLKEQLGNLLLLLTLFAQPLLAEDFAAAISSLGNLNVDANGAFNLPSGILNGMKQGRISPILQMVMSQKIMNACIKRVLQQNVPVRRESFINTRNKFDVGIKRLTCCFNRATILGMLAETSSNPRTGGSYSEGERQASQQMALTLLNQFISGGNCGKGNKTDNTMLMLLAGGGGGR